MWHHQARSLIIRFNQMKSVMSIPLEEAFVPTLIKVDSYSMELHGKLVPKPILAEYDVILKPRREILRDLENPLKAGETESISISNYNELR